MATDRLYEITENNPRGVFHHDEATSADEVGDILNLGQHDIDHIDDMDVGTEVYVLNDQFTIARTR